MSDTFKEWYEQRQAREDAEARPSAMDHAA